MNSVLKATARQRVSYGGRTRWIGGLVRHRGHPFAIECGHRHDTRREAIECAEQLFHADPGSIVAEEIAKASA